MASSSTYEIAPDVTSDDDEDLVATSSNGLLPTHSNSNSNSKGKGRAPASSPQPDRLSPSDHHHRGGGRGGGEPPQVVQGRIGSDTNSPIGQRSQRTTTFGGIKTETRCPTLPFSSLLPPGAIPRRVLFFFFDVELTLPGSLSSKGTRGQTPSMNPLRKRLCVL